MKILLIANMYPNNKYPNYGVFVKNTEEILVQNGYSVDKIVLNKQTNKYKKLFLYFIYFCRIFFTGIFKRYDIIYVHYAAHNSIPLLTLKRIKKNITIYTNVHGSDVVPQLVSQEKYQPYVKKLLSQSSKVIVPSNYFKKLVRQKYQITTPISVFPSGGINKNVFYDMNAKDDICEEFNLDPAYHYLGFVGRLDVGKGWDVFLKALQTLKKKGFLLDKKAIVVGGGKEEEKFKETVQSLGLTDNVVHFPLQPHDKLAKIYNCLDVFCFPTKNESLGLVGLEAMACGVPVIGSRVGGLLDYIEHEKNGLLFDEGNAEDLTSEIQRFFSLSEENKQSMRNKAMKKASEYEIEKIKPALIDIFKPDQVNETLRSAE